MSEPRGVAESPMREWVASGWKFSYDEATRYVQASHPLGGKISVCDVMRLTRSGGREAICFHDIGRAIAEFLSQG